MKSFFRNYHYIFEILVVVIIGLTPLFWNKPGYYATGHDMSYPLAPVDFFVDRLYTWTDRIGPFGRNQTDDVPGLFIHGLQALPVFLGISLITSQKLIFIFWAIAPGISMYLLLRLLFPKKENFLIRVVGSLFYMINHYILQAWTIAEMTKFTMYAGIPIVVMIIINVLYKKRKILLNSLLLSLTLGFFNGGPGIPLWGGLLVVVIPVVFGSLVLSSGEWLVKIKRLAKFMFFSLCFCLVINAYWIFPYLKSFTSNFVDKISSGGGTEGYILWSQGISAHASFINLFRLKGIPDWHLSYFHPYANSFSEQPVLVFLGVVIPLIGALGLIKKKKGQ
jgi:hypothetical protein